MSVVGIGRILIPALFTVEIIATTGPAKLAGISKGDKLISINGNPTKGSSMDLIRKKLAHGIVGEKAKVVVTREDDVTTTIYEADVVRSYLPVVQVFTIYIQYH